ncbi:MAG: hypothetical protein GY885_08050, partial [Phycisphaeraceae bacterium]|nr:hypothetical protein [Phycisphaeraceae bacterium]
MSQDRRRFLATGAVASVLPITSAIAATRQDATADAVGDGGGARRTHPIA